MKIKLFTILICLLFLCSCSSKVVEETTIEEDYTEVVTSSCPRGLVHDEYPGRCGLYQDSDSNGICDLSE